MILGIVFCNWLKHFAISQKCRREKKKEEK